MTANGSGSTPEASAADLSLHPIVIVAAPRSGAQLFADLLAQAADVYIRGEGRHDALARFPLLSAKARGWISDRISDAPPAVLERCRRAYGLGLHDRDDEPARAGRPTVGLEYHPLNALRIPLLREVLPEGRYVHVRREAGPAISSLAEAWHSRRFISHPHLPGWSGPPWSFPLIEGWSDLPPDDLDQITSTQWNWIDQIATQDLASLPERHRTVTSYEQLMAAPTRELNRIADELHIRLDRGVPGRLPLTKTTVSMPSEQKWRLRGLERPVSDLPGRSTTPPPPRVPDASPVVDHGEALFSSSFTDGFLDLLKRFRVSIFVSTYQSGRVINIRAEADRLDTNFRIFERPMGLVSTQQSLIISTRRAIHGYTAVGPAAEGQAHPVDALYGPRHIHITGDIGVHEICLAADGLWLASTRLNCLAVMDPVHSIVPRWRPPFISRIVPEDRCHLNGVATRDGTVRYVTALSRSDSAGGWRQTKGRSGLIIDIMTGDTVAEGLAMPHSPRWHQGHLWVLESGNGGVCRIDPTTGVKDTIVVLPGFTRGLAFAGRVAFVGLSQVRESVFGGLAVSARPDRQCGIWAVDTVTGDILGWLRFEGIVQEIFDVQLCPWAHPEVLRVEDDRVMDLLHLPPEPSRQPPHVG